MTVTHADVGAQHVVHLLELGRAAEAHALLVSLLVSHPGDHRLAHLMGSACLMSGDPAQALVWAGRAVSLEPDDVGAYLVAVDANLGLGRPRPAIAAARTAAALAPQEPFVLCALATALAAGGRRTAGEANLAALEAIRLAPDHPATQFTLGCVLHRRAPDAARAAYRRALALDPTHSAARLNLAVLDARHRGPVRAMHAVHEYAGVLATEPQFQLARTNLDATLNRLVYLVFLVPPLLVYWSDRLVPATPGWLYALVVPFWVWGALWLARTLPRGARQSMRLATFPTFTRRPLRILAILVVGTIVFMFLLVTLMNSQPA